MPVQSGVGYSELTPRKLQDFDSIMAMHISITQAVLRKHPYFKQEYHYTTTLTLQPGLENI
jgi:hypothetical protein